MGKRLASGEAQLELLEFSQLPQGALDPADILQGHNEAALLQIGTPVTQSHTLFPVPRPARLKSGAIELSTHFSTSAGSR